jgi:hypothetical protein
VNANKSTYHPLVISNSLNVVDRLHSTFQCKSRSATPRRFKIGSNADRQLPVIGAYQGTVSGESPMLGVHPEMTVGMGAYGGSRRSSFRSASVTNLIEILANWMENGCNF